MNWTDFKIETETAYLSNAAETAHVHTMSSHATELCGKTLTFFSHSRNGHEQYYDLFEDFVSDLLSNVSHRASYNLTLEESNDDEYLVNMMVGTFFAIHGLDMDEYNYKHSAEDSTDNDFNTVAVPDNTVETFKVAILSVLEKRIKIDAETEEEALHKVRDLANECALYDQDFYYDDWADCEETYKIIEDKY